MTTGTVCVTGAGGFIAAHLVRELLERGYAVRGTVRGNPSERRYAVLRGLEGASERLSLKPIELSDRDGWPGTVRGCDAVIHCASPFRLNVRDPERDLIAPAVVGTRNVIEAAMQSGVPRVVFTSSLTAITDQPLPGKIFTESDWNDRSSVTRNPYYASKAAAERVAWDLEAQAGPGFRLVAINPAFVIGPSIGPALNQSVTVVRDLLSGAYPALLDLNWLVTDVRDVALAHVAAMELDAAKGRYLCAGESVSMVRMAQILREEGLAEGYRLPWLRLTGRCGTALARLLARTRPPGTRSYLETHLGTALRADGSRVPRELGVGYRPARETLRDTVTDLERWGHLRKP